MAGYALRPTNSCMVARSCRHTRRWACGYTSKGSRIPRLYLATYLFIQFPTVSAGYGMPSSLHGRGKSTVANRLSPSFHPTNHFHHLEDKREVFGCLIQCRKDHVFHGKYYHIFILTGPTSCSYGHPQTREHPIRTWPHSRETQKHTP